MIDYHDHAMVCNSTGNQPVNLIPALQFRMTHIVVISTEEAKKQHWTDRLKSVAIKYAIALDDMTITAKAEKSLPNLTDEILAWVANYQKVAWNISGGQKIPTIALYQAFQKRIRDGHTDDIIVYTEGRPPTIWVHDGNNQLSSFKSSALLSLDDMLRLYGSEKTQGEMLYPKMSQTIKDHLAIGTKALKHFTDNKLFREIFFAFMRPFEENAKTTKDIKDMTRKILELNKATFQTLHIKHNEGYKRLEKEVGNFLLEIDKSSDIVSLKKRLNHLRLLQKPKEIFDNYWQSIKAETIDAVIDNLSHDRHPLLTNPISENENRELISQIRSIGGIIRDFTGPICKEDIQKIAEITSRPGILFEWMVASSVMALIYQNETVKNAISEIHINVGTKRSDASQAKQDSEFDLVITTRFGTLILFEMKTHEFSGDVAKGKEGAAYKKSGPFGKAVIVGPIMRDMVRNSAKNEIEYDHYVDKGTQDQETTAWQNNIQYWYLDDVQNKLIHELS